MVPSLALEHMVDAQVRDGACHVVPAASVRHPRGSEVDRRVQVRGAGVGGCPGRQRGDSEEKHVHSRSRGGVERGSQGS